MIESAIQAVLPGLSHLNQASGSFITIEGNIGTGKSTFSAALAKLRGPNSLLLEEPVHKPAFRALLGNYYADPKRWGFTFQMYALKERFKQHTLAAELTSHGVSVVQDRAIYSDGCFGDLVRADGNMTQDEWDIYAETFGALKRYLRYPDAMIYLRADPQICLERVKRRARSEESSVPLDYLKRLHDQHDQLASAMSHYTRVLTLDWNVFDPDIQSINTRLNQLMAEQRPFLRDFNRI